MLSNQAQTATIHLLLLAAEKLREAPQQSCHPLHPELIQPFNAILLKMLNRAGQQRLPNGQTAPRDRPQKVRRGRFGPFHGESQLGAQ